MRLGDWQGINIETFSMDLGTEYWLTQAGRGAFRDQVDDAKIGYKGLKDILTREGTILEKIVAEKEFREYMAKGFFETAGKTKEEIVKEAQERLGTNADILFYDGKTIGDLTGAQLEHLTAYGFVIKADGSIWINEGSLANNTLDFNKLFFHEFAHSNGLNEVQANYIEQSYGQFLDEVNANGYITADGKIKNWGENTLSFSNLMTLLTVTPDGIEMKTKKGLTYEEAMRYGDFASKGNSFMIDRPNGAYLSVYSEEMGGNTIFTINCTR